MELLRSLKKEQILELLSDDDALCSHCLNHLQARITSLRKRKMDEKSDNGIVSSRSNGHPSQFYNRRRHEKPEHSPMNYVQRHHQSAFFVKPSRHAADSSHRRRRNFVQFDFEFFDDELDGKPAFESGLFEEEEEEEEFIRYSQVHRKKNFFHTRRLEKHEDNRRNYRYESTILMKPNKHSSDSSQWYKNNKRQPLKLLNGGHNGDLRFESDLSEEEMESLRFDETHDSFQRRETTLSMKRNWHEIYSFQRNFNRKKQSLVPSDFDLLLNDGIGGEFPCESEFSDEHKECTRLSLVQRNTNFVHFEKINGTKINVVEGLELHTGVFNVEEQKNIVKYVYELQRMGRNGQLRARTYSEPRKWMRGKGRVTIQFGCCYNYAEDKYGNPPGIMRDEEVDPLPHLFKQMIKRMVKWHVLPPTCIPDSCIVNIYDEGDCIPPHIDHHDFVRPFSTVSLLSECDIVFGSNLKVVSPGQFSGPVPITLPVGSVFILNGNGADIAKHCVPSVSAKRISITFRKMDDKKLPFMFSPDSELMGIKPLSYSPSNNKQIVDMTILRTQKCNNRRQTLLESVYN